jgi:hypothetical protein
VFSEDENTGFVILMAYDNLEVFHRVSASSTKRARVCAIRIIQNEEIYMLNE